MNPSDNPQHFHDRAQEHQLVISTEDAANIGEVRSSVASIYAAIREIDTIGFEPAAIFVPTPSKRKGD